MLSYTNVVARKAKKTYDSTIGRIVKLSSRARAHIRYERNIDKLLIIKYENYNYYNFVIIIITIL